MRIFGSNRINFLNRDKFLQCDVAVRFGLERAQVRRRSLERIVPFRTRTRAQVGALYDDVINRTQVAVFEP
jgi:hypothetical protein